MANETILLVDDDHDMRGVLELYLVKENFNVYTVGDASVAMTIVKEKKPQLIILDVMMPHLDGFELCQSLRKETNVPILFLSSKEDDIDKIIGLSVGGDDYMTKSTSLPVIVAKVKAHLRRDRHSLTDNEQPLQEMDNAKSTLEFPGLTIKLDSAVVKVNGSVIKLSAKEYQLLTLMAKSPERIYSVEQLFDIIWGEDSLGDYRTVMVHVSNLRRKIQQSPEVPTYIQTFRGIGYKFMSSDSV